MFSKSENEANALCGSFNQTSALCGPHNQNSAPFCQQSTQKEHSKERHPCGRFYRQPGAKPLTCFHCESIGHDNKVCDVLCFVCNVNLHKKCQCNIKSHFGSMSHFRKVRITFIYH